MKNLFIILALLSFIPEASAQAWVKEKAKDGITVYTKSSTQYRMKASRADMIVSTSVDKLVEAIFDVKAYTSWMPDCAKVQLLKSVSSDELIYYAVYLTPWPAANRDVIVNIKKVPIPGGYKILMTNKSNYLEVNTDVVRIPIYFGEWHFVKTNLGTKVSIEYQTDPGGSVPDWMIQGASTKTPFDLFEALKKRI